MWISALMIDTGTNPDRPRPGRLWLRNAYRVHQRLCMAFPSSSEGNVKVARDEHFLEPFCPSDFPELNADADRERPADGWPTGMKPVHRPRSEGQGFLFRVDPLPGGNAMILVVSAIEPDWEYAFHNAKHFLRAEWPLAPRRFEPTFTLDESLRFRLFVNPTQREPFSKEKRLAIKAELAEKAKVAEEASRESSEGRKEGGSRVKRPRLPVTWDNNEDPSEVLTRWLLTRSQRLGFAPDPGSISISRLGYVYARKGPDRPTIRFRSACFEGRLKVTNVDIFKHTLNTGVGSAKAFGFGLLSIARDAGPVPRVAL